MGASRGPAVPEPKRHPPTSPAVNLSGSNHSQIVEMDQNYTEVTDKVKSLKAVYEMLDGHQSTLMEEVNQLQTAAVKLGTNGEIPEEQVKPSPIVPPDQVHPPSTDKPNVENPKTATGIQLSAQAVAAVFNLVLFITGANPLEGPDQAALLGTLQLVAAAIATAYINFPRSKA